MTGRDSHEPLWASSLADRSPTEYDDVVVVRVLEESEDVPPPPGDRQPVRRPRVVIGVLATIGMVALLVALQGREALRVEEVPSFWEDIPMTCETTRLEQDERAVETFRCRAIGGLELPPGLYRSPGARWTSDFTRRDARESRIQISPDGEMVGWATY